MCPFLYILSKAAFFKRFYLFIHERHRKKQREKQAPCKEPDVGLDPMTPGSQPEPKADAQPLSYPDAPNFLVFIVIFLSFFLKNSFIHSVIHQRERGRDIGRGRSRLPARSPMWDSIPGPRDHDLSRRQMLNH